MQDKGKLALICGGVSSERNVSLASARRIYSAIDRGKYDVIVYDPISDIPELVANSAELDFAFIALHGSFGEDGTIQGLLDLLGVPYQGSGVLGSAIAMDKVVSKHLFEQAGLPVAPYLVIKYAELNCDNCAVYIESKLGYPVILKPIKAGSSIDISVVEHKEDFNEAALKILNKNGTVLVEAYLEGIELTCGILGNKKLEALPLVEIVSGASSVFFDYASKHSSTFVRRICPARISDFVTKKAQMYAKLAHNVLCCRGYSRTDMIFVNDDFYILETNTIPGMTMDSLYPKAASARGIPFDKLIEKLIDLGLEDIK